jgi:hypothetical protein
VGDLVGVGHVRQARAEVEELAHALTRHVVDHPLQQMPALHAYQGWWAGGQGAHAIATCFAALEKAGQWPPGVAASMVAEWPRGGNAT